MDSAPADRYGPGRNFTAPCLRTLGRLSFHRVGCGANRPSANIWVGARRYSPPIGSGSAPSDPRRTNHIGNLGIRKSVKIRKIEKACSNHPIANPTSSRHNHPGQNNRSGEHADSRRQRVPADRPSHGRSGRFPPWKACPGEPGFTHEVPGRPNLPKISFEPHWGRTLETLSCRREQSGNNALAVREGRSDPASWGGSSRWLPCR